MDGGRGVGGGGGFISSLLQYALRRNTTFRGILIFQLSLIDFPGQTGASSSGNNPRTSLSFAGTNLWRCDAHVVEVCDLNCLDVDPKDGCPFCIQSCRMSFLLHSPSFTFYISLSKA